ncbi:MAG: A24 family peptidase, partial [Planctomycetota bacterium]
PRGESLVAPRSRCPGCGRPIAWYDNIPVLSWLLLRGRCRQCSMRIAVRYPLVEALTGGLFLLTWLRYGETPFTAAFVAAALAALVAISFIDWEHKIIPDRITKPGIVLAVALAPLTVLHPATFLPGVGPTLAAWAHAAAGAGAGALVILLIRWFGHLVFRKEAMGLGDVKLLAFLGAFVGPLGVLYVLILASLSGAILGIVRLLWARKRPLRFPLEVVAGKRHTAFDGARIGDGHLTVFGPEAIGKGTRVTVAMQLPAAGILEDEDARIEVKGRVDEVEAVGAGHAWRIRVLEASEEDGERLALYGASLRYVPFGPFLAIGGAAVLLFGDQVHWLIAEGYPRWVHGLMR